MFVLMDMARAHYWLGQDFGVARYWRHFEAELVCFATWAEARAVVRQLRAQECYLRVVRHPRLRHGLRSRASLEAYYGACLN